MKELENDEENEENEERRKLLRQGREECVENEGVLKMRKIGKAEIWNIGKKNK